MLITFLDSPAFWELQSIGPSCFQFASAHLIYSRHI